MLGSLLKPIEVLLVEDNAGDVRLTEEALKEGKLAVRLTVARDGLEAMEILHQRSGNAGAPRPDLILLDLNLPKMDGRQVLQEIKNDPNLMRIPVGSHHLRSGRRYFDDLRCPRQLLHHQARRHGPLHQYRPALGRVLVHHRQVACARHLIVRRGRLGIPSELFNMQKIRLNAFHKSVTRRAR